MFDMDYFNSPAFQQAIAAAVGPRRTAYQAPQAFREGGRSIGGRGEYADDLYDVQDAEQFYDPAPVSDPVYNYSPPPASYDYQDISGIGGIDQFAREDYGLIAPAEEVYVSQGPSAEEIAAAQAEADRAVAQAEADRVAAEQEYFARAEAERLALARAQALEAEAERTQNEAIAARAEQARIAVEQAAAERAAAEQVAAQAQVAEQQAVQTQTVVQEAVQQVAEVQAAEQVYTPAPAAEPFRGIGGRGEYEGDVYAAQVPETYAPAPTPAPAPAPAAVYTPAPEPAPVQTYTPDPAPFRGIGRRGEEDLYRSEVQAAETYTPAPAAAPEPAPVYNAAPEPVRGIGRSDGEGYYQQEEIYTPAAEVAEIQAEPVAGIGSPFVAAADTAPSVIETAAAAPVPAPASDTGLQVINANDYSPSETDLQTMGMSRDQWNEMMASFATMDLGNLNFGTNFGITNPDYTDKFRVFTAPKSNKGNATSTVAKKDNTFNVIEGQPVRLVDQRTGKVVFQGTGYEAAEKAIELAAGLTKEGGNKADWEIQTGQFKNPGSGDLVFGDTFKTVANEKKNVSVLNQALDIVGDAALGFIIGGPIGAAIAAGASAAGVNVSDIAYPIIAATVLAPVGFAAVAGAAALGSAVSSAVQGRSIEETLIRAGVTGLTAGIMSGTDIGGTVSDAVGGVLKDIGVESQVGNIISGIGGSGTVDAVTGDIIVNAATDAAVSAIASGATGAAVGSAIVDAVQQVVPDYVPSPETETLLNQVDEAATTAAEVAADPTIVVTANPVETVLSGANPIVETAAGIAGGFTNVGDLVDSPEIREKIAEEKARTEEPKEEIVVTATPEPEVIPMLVPETAGIGGIVPVEVPPSEVAAETPEEEIVVNAPETVDVPVPTPEVAGIGGPIPDVLPDDIVVNAPETVDAPPEEPTPVVTGIGGPIPDVLPDDIVVNAPKTETTTTDNDTVPTVTPDPGIGTGSVTDTLEPPDLEPDPELTDDDSVLDTIKDVADVAGTVLPIVAGGGGGGGGGTIGPDTSKLNFRTSTLRPTLTGGVGIGGRYPYTPQTYGRAGGDQETEYLFFTRDPVTGQAVVVDGPPGGQGGPPGKKEGGEIEDDMVKHLVEYQKNGGHHGPGQVKGIGSGQEDKIPAWLSDGEYVWSAQDVADLGDGSTDEGVRRLDKMRQMVRQQAGRKDVKKIAKPQKGIDRMLKAVGGLA